jgi:predicted GTPase
MADPNPLKGGLLLVVVALGKILTLNNLRKPHIIVINKCCICKKKEESVDHLLLHCDVASALWYSLVSRFGLSWVMPQQN